jgi:molybdopterin synthase sulfur carrier subunit
LTIFYFAWVRQKVGIAGEHFPLPAHVKTIAELIEFLCLRGGGYAAAFNDPGRLCAAVNQKYASFETGLTGEDEVAFFPPVTGG